MLRPERSCQPADLVDLDCRPVQEIPPASLATP